ncbi:MAG: protein-tyrosine-phosphatase [Flavobacteriales bacterium]|nr:protein-tyrosine-phosphatase [Flavobacteriales bacterium]
MDSYIKSCFSNLKDIPKERKKDLDKLSAYIKTKLINGEMVNLTFICTHNSRRSQFGQIRAATAAAYLGIRNVQTYSGGTEATSFNTKAVDAIRLAGFSVDKTLGINPHYSVRFSDAAGAIECFSKKFDDSFNPQKGFAAIMTCSTADEDCPLVAGAEFRIPLTYQDPKVADGTINETATYNERCKQIATEMLYLFGNV